MGKVIPCTDFARAGRARLHERIAGILKDNTTVDPQVTIEVGRLIVDESRRLYSLAVTDGALRTAPHLFVIGKLIADGFWPDVPAAEQILLEAVQAYIETESLRETGA